MFDPCRREFAKSRPVCFKYGKENKAVVQAVYDYFKNYDLVPTMINTLAVKHNIEIIMVDGKISTLLSQTTNSAHCCTVCDCSPKQMNKLLGLLLFISHCRKIVYDSGNAGTKNIRQQLQ